MTAPNRGMVIVLPCSGVGKVAGTVAREAAYELCENLRPDLTRIGALAMLVLGDDEAKRAIAASPVVAIDGCALRCAAVLAKRCGAQRIHEVSVQEAFREHRELKPQGIAELNPAGRELARKMAEGLVAQVDALVEGGGGTPC